MSDRDGTSGPESGLAATCPQRDENLRRRTFLKRSGIGALGFSIVPVTGLSASTTARYTPNSGTFGDGVARTLLRMARDIFPHDQVPDVFYAAVTESYDKKAVDDTALKSLIITGVTDLNTASMKRFSYYYADLPAEGDRITLLYSIEHSVFFQKIRGDLLLGLYNNKDVWPLFGYQGVSWDKGGYLHRGFDDISWLPRS